MIEIVQAPNKKPLENFNDNIKLFIAGGISNCPNWQNDLITKLTTEPLLKKYERIKITIFNPRAKEIPEENTQIEWEYDRLKISDIVSFWFSEGSLNPITLFEYGSNFRNKNIVVGCHPNYQKINNVKVQTQLEKPNQKVNENFDDFYNELLEKTIEQIEQKNLNRAINMFNKIK